MKEQEIRLRITKKTKTHVTLDMKLYGEQSFPWEEFNKIYRVVDNVWATFNEEYIKKHEQAEEYITNAVVAYMMTNMKDAKYDAHYLANLSILGESVEKISEILGVSRMDAMVIIRKQIADLRGEEYYTGLEDPKRMKRYENRRRNHDNKNLYNGNDVNVGRAKSSKDNKFTPEQNTYSVMSDNPALAKLRAQMEAENNK